MKRKIFTMLLLLPYLVQAQFTSVEVASVNNAGHSAVVVNKKMVGNIVVAIQDGIYASTDGGKTWKQSSTITNGFDHQLISDKKGELIDVFVSSEKSGDHFEKILGQASKDGGISWTPVGAVHFPGKDIRDPSICNHPKSGDLMLAWTSYDRFGSDAAEDKSRVMLSLSKDGKKWSEPIQISQVEGNCLDNSKTPRGATPGINSDDQMFVMWSMDGKIQMDRSFDKGNRWLTNDIFVTDQPGGWAFPVPGSSQYNGVPTILIDNSPSRFNRSLFLAWADQKNGEADPDVWFARSLNYGDIWATPVRVNDDEKGSLQFAPAMAVDQSDGNIYIAYFDRRDHDDEQTDLYLAYSNDNGVSFTNVKVSDKAFALAVSAEGSSTSIDAHKGVITVVWNSLNEDKQSLHAVTIKKDELIKPAEAKKEAKK
jgi:hypothetical protein